jgi:hypothetical protein
MTNADATIPEIYTVAGTEQVAINGLNSLTTDKTLALGFVPGQANTFSIKASEISNFDTNTKIILRDNLNALTPDQELTVGSTYSFSSDAAATASRFSLIFKSAGTTTDINNAANMQHITIFKNANNQIVVNYATENIGKTTVSVFNAVGQKLEEKAMLSTNTVLNRTYNTGVYIVNISANGKLITKKIVIN